MKITHLLALLPLAGTLAPTLAAQSNPPPLLGAEDGSTTPGEDDYFLPQKREFPAGLPGTSQWQKTVTASLNGFAVPDVVVLDGGTPVMSIAPGLHQTISDLPKQTSGSFDNVFDLAVLRGRGRADGSAPTLDALVLATQNGTFVWRRDFGTGRGRVETVGGTAWNTTRLVAVHRNNAQQIFGIDTAGVLRRADLTTPVPPAAPTYVNATTTYGTFANATALTLVDWDSSSPGNEIAVLTTTALTILRQNGTVAYSTPASNTPGQLLATVHGPQEWLAWLSPSNSGGSLLQYGRANTFHATMLASPYVGMTAVSMDFDDFDELLLSTEQNDDVTVLFNQAFLGQLPFANPSLALRVAIAEPDSRRVPNGANVAAADFDADGDVDLLAAVGAGSNGGPAFQAQFFKYYANAGRVQPLTADFSTNALGEQQFDMTFTQMAGFEVQVMVWKEGQLPNGEYTTGGMLEPLANTYLPATSGVGSFSFPVDGEHLDDGGHYHVMLRPVLRSNGTVSAVAPAYLGIVWRVATDPTKNSRQRGLQRAGGGWHNGTRDNIRVGGVIGSGPIPPAPPGWPPPGLDD